MSESKIANCIGLTFFEQSATQPLKINVLLTNHQQLAFEYLS